MAFKTKEGEKEGGKEGRKGKNHDYLDLLFKNKEKNYISTTPSPLLEFTGKQGNLS